jgi:hypothetical protein
MSICCYECRKSMADFFRNSNRCEECSRKTAFEANCVGCRKDFICFTSKQIDPVCDQCQEAFNNSRFETYDMLGLNKHPSMEEWSPSNGVLDFSKEASSWSLDL